MKSLEAAFGVWSSGGWLLLPLAGVSVVIFLLIFRSVLSLRPLIALSGELGRRLESCGGDRERIRACLQERSSWLAGAYAESLTAGKGAAPLMDRLEGIEEGCVRAQSRELLLLSAFTAAAPLLGLLGTVVGMINTFQASATLTGDTGQQIADGIRSALITTQFGLVIALPGVFGIAHIRKRIRDLGNLMGQCRFLIAGAFSPSRGFQTGI